MDKLIPVWDHIQGVFWFWLVWKCLDLLWAHNKCDDKVNNVKGWVKSKIHQYKSWIHKIIKKLESTVI